MRRTVLLAGIAVGLAFGAATAQRELAEIDRLLEAGKGAEARERAEAAVETYPEAAMAWFLLARARHAAGDLEGAIEAGEVATRYPGVRASSYYNLACAHALLGHRDEAMEALALAKLAGFANRNLMRADPDLESVRDDPRFVLPVERRYDVLDVGDSRGLPYSLDLPPDYDPDGVYPVLVGPGDAEPNPEEPGSLYWGEDAVQRGWIVVESPAFVSPDPVEKTGKLLDHIEAQYHIEGGRFHLAAFGVSAVGAFQVAMAMPERVHSVTAVPGYPVVESESELAQIDGVTINMIVGENDGLWLAESRFVHDRLRRMGVESYLEVVPDAGHIIEPMFGGELMNRLDALRGEPR
jgi:hypothetical protein